MWNEVPHGCISGRAGGDCLFIRGSPHAFPPFCHAHTNSTLPCLGDATKQVPLLLLSFPSLIPSDTATPAAGDTPSRCFFARADPSNGTHTKTWAHPRGTGHPAQEGRRLLLQPAVARFDAAATKRHRLELSNNRSRGGWEARLDGSTTHRYQQQITMPSIHLSGWDGTRNSRIERLHDRFARCADESHLRPADDKRGLRQRDDGQECSPSLPRHWDALPATKGRPIIYDCV